MIDDIQSIPDGTQIEAEVCIVGSGAVGIALARELANTHYKVLMLESGGWEFEPETQRLYDVVSTGVPFPGATSGRFRTLGGSTTRWGGQVLPLTESDFLPRPWVNSPGWPMTLGTLEGYYRRAVEYLRVDPLNFDTDIFSRVHTLPPPFDPAIGQYHYSKWSPTPNLREVYSGLLKESKNLTVLLHANLTDIQLNADGTRVHTVQIRSLQGRRATAKARIVVLALGGVETPRMLLACNRQISNGIGNHSGLVGKFFQDHPAGVVGRVRRIRSRSFQRLFTLALNDGLKYAVRISAATEFQKKHAILNATAAIISEIDADSPLSTAKEAYRLLRSRQINKRLFAALARSVAGAPALVRPAWHLMVNKRIYNPGPFQLGIGCEQDADALSQITLAEERDALDIPKARIHWHLSDLVRRTISTYAHAMKSEFERLGLANIELEPWITDESLLWLPHIHDQNHHMGATRMDAHAASGVVDPQLFVHNIDNLAIASSSVFPTSGHSNPTFTLLALTMRLSDEIRRRLDA